MRVTRSRQPRLFDIADHACRRLYRAVGVEQGNGDDPVHRAGPLRRRGQPLFRSRTRQGREVDPGARRDHGPQAAAVAHARAFDDNPGHDRPGMRADPVLGFPQPVPGLQRDVGLRQAVSRPEARRAEPVGRDRAQLIEPGAMMSAAQRFADQPPDVVELRIVGRQHPVGAHGVERIEKAARPVCVYSRRLPRILGAGEALRGRVESLLEGPSISWGDLRVRLVGLRAPLI
jgi:hypothetical protein